MATTSNTNVAGLTPTGYTASGITTLLWGTDGLLASPAPGGSFAGTGFYIVESLDETTKAEQVYIENGTGIEAARINLTHGHRWNLTVQDDTNINGAALEVGQTVTVMDGAGLLGGARTATYTAVVLSVSERFARKAAATRTIEVEKLTLVD